MKELCQQSKYQKRVKDHIDQLDLTIENRERELSRTYLVEELNKMKDKNLS